MTMTVRFDTNGDGYEQIRASDGQTINHHRLLMWAWGRLDSPFFSEDAREIHHEREVEWINFEMDLSALTPEEHREVDPGRARIKTPWDRRAER